MWKLLFKPEFKKPKQLVSELRSEAWRPFSTALAIDKELAGWLACFPVLGLFPTFPFNRPLLLSFSEATGRMKGMARLKTAYSNETDCVCACEGGHPIIQYNTKIIYINMDKTWGCLRCAGYLEGQGPRKRPKMVGNSKSGFDSASYAEFSNVLFCFLQMSMRSECPWFPNVYDVLMSIISKCP